MRAFTTTSETSSEMAESEGSMDIEQPGHVPYERGAVLNLVAEHLGNRLLTVRVSRVYRPLSSSCVMAVEIIDGLSKSDDVPQRAVLKLFDRRFAAGLRRDHKIEAWNHVDEEAFVGFVNSGMADRFASFLQQSEYLDEPETGWSAAESETYLQGWCSDLFDTELETYQHMRALQGKEIPKIFSAVTMAPRSKATTPEAILNQTPPLLQVPGLLMEHIVGHTLAEMPDDIPARYWQTIFDDALKVVHTVSDHGVMNEGLSVSNIIASPEPGAAGNFRTAMVDLAQCSIQQPGQSHLEWSRLKAAQDEEGTIGRAMLTILRKVNFQLRYKPSNRFGSSEANE